MRNVIALATVSTLVSVLLSISSSVAMAQRVIQQRDYDCKLIWREPGGAAAGPYQNARGDVAFSAIVSNGTSFEQQIRLGRGDSLPNGDPKTHLLARDSNDPNAMIASFLSEPIIDDLGRATFIAFRPTNSAAIFAANGLSLPYVLIDTNGNDPASPFDGFPGGSVAMPSAVGAVLFRAAPTGASGLNVGYYRNMTYLAPSGGVDIPSFPSALIAGNSLDVGWIGQELNSLRMAVVLNQSIVDESQFDPGQGDWVGAFFGLSISSNALPFVAYSRDSFPPSPAWKIVVTSSLGRSTLVDASVDPVDPFTLPPTSVNAWGEVAFVTNANLFARSILIADGGPVLYRMNCPEYGNLLSNYNISPRALNADGQIAFGATYFDPQTFVQYAYLMRADPLPGQGARPTACVGLVDGTPCDDGDPETLSSCLTAVCVGDPLGRPLSCVGLADNEACDDLDPGTYSFCRSEACLGVPVPEPGWVASMLIGWAALGLASRREGRLRI